MNPFQGPDSDAFPCSEQQTSGLSIRDYIATVQMHALLARHGLDLTYQTLPECAAKIAQQAVVVADALIAELRKPQKGGV